MELYRLIKIGEMAKLFGLNIRTLRYYDEINLLKPAYTDENTGYRYYSIEQFEQLNVIRYFRAQGMSLDAIQTAMEHRSPQKIQGLLREQLIQVNRELSELQKCRLRLKTRIEHIDRIMDPARMYTLTLRELPERPYVSLELRLRGDANLEMHLRSLEKKSGIAPSFFLGKVGLSIPLQDLMDKKVEHYQKLFCLVEPGETDVRPDQSLPSGLWAKWRFLGHHPDSPAQYLHMLELLEKKKLRPIGDAAEFTLLDSGLVEDPKDYTTEIQIPVAYF